MPYVICGACARSVRVRVYVFARLFGTLFIFFGRRSEEFFMRFYLKLWTHDRIWIFCFLLPFQMDAGNDTQKTGDKKPETNCLLAKNFIDCVSAIRHRYRDVENSIRINVNWDVPSSIYCEMMIISQVFHHKRAIYENDGKKNRLIFVWTESKSWPGEHWIYQSMAGCLVCIHFSLFASVSTRN